MTEKFLQGGWSCFLIRKRYIDEQLIESMTENKIKTLINQVAGSYTRLNRLSETQNIS